MRKIVLVAAALLALIAPARADYVIKDGNGATQYIKSNGSGAIGDPIRPLSTPVDSTGAAFALANPLAITYGTGVTLPSFATPQHFICDSGCGGGGGGLSVPFAGAIGANGTPTGFKDGSGNFQPLLGDVTNGQWVTLKGTLPAFAATPTVNIGTAPSIAVTQGTAANLNATATLAAGSAIVGKVGIDQTTPGTTNLVSIGSNGTVNPATAANWGLYAQNSATSGLLGQLMMAAVNSGTPSYTAAQTSPLSQTTAGALRVDASSTTQPTVGFAAYSTATITRPANTTTYTVNTGWNNATSGATNFFSLTAACRVNGGQVLIPRIDIWSSANPSLKLSGVLWLFSAVPGTNVNDNAAFNIASADFANLTAGFNGISFTLASNQSAGSNSGTSLSGTSYQAQCASGTTTITGMVEVTNAYIPASGEVLHVGIATIGAN